MKPKILWNKGVKNYSCTLLFEKRDLWIGIFWDNNANSILAWEVYICLIPMFPIRFRRYAYVTKG